MPEAEQVLKEVAPKPASLAAFAAAWAATACSERALCARAHACSWAHRGAHVAVAVVSLAAVLLVLWRSERAFVSRAKVMVIAARVGRGGVEGLDCPSTALRARLVCLRHVRVRVRARLCAPGPLTLLALGLSLSQAVLSEKKQRKAE
jgi:TRAP-type uncharacterized transport system fused permease subunit